MVDMIQIKILTVFYTFCWIALSEGLTYQECLVQTHVANVTNCPPHTNHDQVLCTTDGAKLHGKCEFSKHFCSEVYLHHRNVQVNGTGTNCVPIHVNTPRPVTAEQAKLFKAILDGIDNRLDLVETKINSSDTIHIFRKQDHTHKAYVRNPDCWAHDLDLTCISPWNSQGHTRKAGVLISPRHAVWARHYNIKIGSTIRFVDRNNSVVDRKVVKSHAVPMPSTVHGRGFLHGYDIVVGLLDSDVPSTITFAKVLPKNFTLLMPTNPRLPVLSTDYEEKALVDDFAYMRNEMVALTRPRSTLRLPYYETKITGDSGNPNFFVIDSELVFLFVFTYGGAGSGSSVQFHHDNINKVMRQLGGNYQLTEIDLSKYITNAHITQIFG